jgi:hypothetical protein
VSWMVDLPEFAKSNINVLELQTVYVAAQGWGHLWGGKHILVQSDNSSTVASINKGTSRSVDMLEVIQNLFWLSVRYGFKLSAEYLPGRLNIISDGISRMHDVSAAGEVQSLLSSDSVLETYGHMTQRSFIWLQDSWAKSCQP